MHEPTDFRDLTNLALKREQITTSLYLHVYVQYILLTSLTCNLREWTKYALSMLTEAYCIQFSQCVVDSPTVVLFHGVSARNYPSCGIVFSFRVLSSRDRKAGTRAVRTSISHAIFLFGRISCRSALNQQRCAPACLATYSVTIKLDVYRVHVGRNSSKIIELIKPRMFMEIHIFWKYCKEAQRLDFPRDSIIDKRGLTCVTRAGRIKMAWALRCRRSSSILINHWLCRPAEFH